MARNRAEIEQISVALPYPTLSHPHMQDPNVKFTHSK
jgi:hypothetical protein